MCADWALRATRATIKKQHREEEAMRFQGKVAVITAAGAGIGRATAEIVAREGATVVAVDVNKERLDALASALAGAPGRIVGKNIDAGNEAAVRALVAEVAETYGGIDILVNGVGGSTIVANPAARVDELSFEDWQRLIDFNLNATFLFINAVVPVMKKAGRGKIVSISSIAGRGLSALSSSAYAAAKGGIIALTRKLADELGPHGITINAIAPSLTLTERLRPHWEKRSPADQAAVAARVPLGRIAEAADQAKVIAFLASADADFVTGITIDVTGGQS
jgi:NAD(P)-dependent dehydrogenase (short-subunit alcohol dehydrogenase family)